MPKLADGIVTAGDARQKRSVQIIFFGPLFGYLPFARNARLMKDA